MLLDLHAFPGHLQPSPFEIVVIGLFETPSDGALFRYKVIEASTRERASLKHSLSLDVGFALLSIVELNVLLVQILIALKRSGMTFNSSELQVWIMSVCFAFIEPLDDQDIIHRARYVVG